MLSHELTDLNSDLSIVLPVAHQGGRIMLVLYLAACRDPPARSRHLTHLGWRTTE